MITNSNSFNLIKKTILMLFLVIITGCSDAEESGTGSVDLTEEISSRLTGYWTSSIFNGFDLIESKSFLFNSDQSGRYDSFEDNAYDTLHISWSLLDKGRGLQVTFENDSTFETDITITDDDFVLIFVDQDGLRFTRQ